MWAPWSGHLFMGAIEAPVVLLCLWLLTFIPTVGDYAFGQLVLVVVIGSFVNETVATFVDRAFVLHYRKDDPGSKLNAILDCVVAFVVGFASGKVILGSLTGGATLAIAIGGVKTVEMLWSRAWNDGMSREEFHERHERVKAMTREMVQEDREERARRAIDKQRKR
ncbi:MAG: hypothetical protein IMW91_11030 [Firmicutes bacterium]|nr:hypothetical protein [Bacillota bacterium]